MALVLETRPQISDDIPAEKPVPARLRNQRDKDLVDQLFEIEALAGEPFFASDERTQEALELDEKQLKERYPLRYLTYLKILRAAAAHRAANRSLVRAMADSPLSHEDEDHLSHLDAVQKEETQLDLATDPAPLTTPAMESSHDFISARNYIRMMKSLESYRDSYKTETPHGILRPHQIETIDDLIMFLNSGLQRGYIEMPTGSGKTGVFVELVKALAHDREGSADHTPIRTLIIVPKKDLVRQTVGDPDKGGFARFAPDMRATSYYESDKDLTGEVVVTTYQSLVTSLMPQGKITPNMFDVIISDEAHYALGARSRQEIDQLMALCPEALLIGLTATAEYSPEEGRQVRSIFEHSIHYLGLAEAIRRKILSPLKWEFFTTNTEIVIRSDQEIVTGEDYSQEVLRQLNNEQRNREAVRIAVEKVESGKHFLMSCLPKDRQSDIGHVHLMAELCNGQPVRVRDPKTGELTEETRPMRVLAITNETSEKDRAEYYKQYELGEIDGFCFVDVLKEGVDLPSAKVLINLRPTPSPVLAKQRAGRVLRLTDQEAEIIEFIDQFSRNRPYTVNEMFGPQEIVADERGGHVRIDRDGGGGDIDESDSEELPEGAQLQVEYIAGGEMRPPELPAAPPGPVERPDVLIATEDGVYRDRDGKVWQDARRLGVEFGLSAQSIETLEHRLGVKRVAKRDEQGGLVFAYNIDEVRRKLEDVPEIQDRAFVDERGVMWVSGYNATGFLRKNTRLGTEGIDLQWYDLAQILLEHRELVIGKMIGSVVDSSGVHYQDLYRLDDLKRFRVRLESIIRGRYKTARASQN